MISQLMEQRFSPCILRSNDDGSSPFFFLLMLWPSPNFFPREGRIAGVSLESFA